MRASVDQCGRVVGVWLRWVGFVVGGWAEGQTRSVHAGWERSERSANRTVPTWFMRYCMFSMRFRRSSSCFALCAASDRALRRSMSSCCRRSCSRSRSMIACCCSYARLIVVLVVALLFCRARWGRDLD